MIYIHGWWKVEVQAIHTYRRTATRSINRRVASRRPTATNMVLHLFLAKVERKLDYSRAKLPSDVGRREKRPMKVGVPLLADSQSTKPLSSPIISTSRFVTGPPLHSDGLIFLMRETAWSRKKTFSLRSLEKARVAGWLYLLPKIMSFLVGGEAGSGSSNISGESNKRGGGGRHP